MVIRRPQNQSCRWRLVRCMEKCIGGNGLKCIVRVRDCVFDFGYGSEI